MARRGSSVPGRRRKPAHTSPASQVTGLAHEQLSEWGSPQGFTGRVEEGPVPHTGDPQGILLGWGSAL